MNTTSKCVLEARHAVSIYSGANVLQFHIQLKEGLIYTLQGANQSGKTTLIKTLTGTLTKKNNAGINVLLNGQEVHLKSPADAIERGIVAVFQDDELIPSMNIKMQLRLRHAYPRWQYLRATRFKRIAAVSEWLQDIVSLPSFFSIRPPSLGSEDEVDKKALELLKSYSTNSSNYTDNLEMLPREMSGGAKAVARLISAQLTPNIKVLLLDEVFRGVQSDAWPHIVDTIRAWAKENKIAVLITTHNDDEIIRWQPDERLKISLKEDGADLVNIKPFGYKSLNAGLPLRIRHFPVFDIDGGQNWINAIDHEIPVLILADKCIVDSHAYSDVYNALKAKLGTELDTHFVEVSESLKSWESVKDIMTELSDKLPQQDVCMVIIGGGVLLNFGGFIASTLHRGVQFIHIPTTIMSIADVAVGSKTSLNLNAQNGSKKHFMGTYSNPMAVVMDKRFIETLPKKEKLLGLSECLKHGLLQNSEHFENVIKSIRNINENIHSHTIYDIAYKTMEFKSNILLHDPWENKGLGYILLYGHLHAHSLERVTSFKICHGLAVYIGIMVDLDLAGLDQIKSTVIGAFRSAGLHQDQQFKSLIELSSSEKFYSDLEIAYKNDPKPHHHSKPDKYGYLHVSKMGEFSAADNSTVSEAMKEVTFNLIVDSYNKIFKELT